MKKLFAVLLILAGYAVGQTTKTQQAPKPSKGQYTTADITPERSHAGRYQIFFSPHARADVYLLDTETGKIWHPVTISNAKDANLNAAPEVWLYQDRIDSEQEFDVWQALHQPPKPAPPQ
jgi:hypothetical protein